MKKRVMAGFILILTVAFFIGIFSPMTGLFTSGPLTVSAAAKKAKKPAKKTDKKTKTKDSKTTKTDTGMAVDQRNLTLCTYNARQISDALKKYFDENGKYPATLIELYPRYISGLPRCPVVQKSTYSDSYTVSPDGKSYSFSCTGENHKNLSIPPNYPSCTAEKGIEVKPGVFDTGAPLAGNETPEPVVTKPVEDSPETLYKKGMAAYDAREYAAAKDFLERAVKSAKLDYSYEKQAKYTLQEVNHKLSQMPTNNSAADDPEIQGTPAELYRKGMTLYDNQDFGKAKQYLTKAVNSGKLDYSEEKQAKKALEVIAAKGL